MADGDDIRAMLAILERQQQDHQMQQEILMRIESRIIRAQSPVGPNVTLGFVKLVDATGRLHPIPMDVCDSFERFNGMLQLLLEHNSIEARIQRRYMEQGQCILCIDDGKQATRLTSNEWPSIEAGTKIVMSVIIEQHIPSEVYYLCPFCGDVNCLDIRPVMYSFERQAICSIDCRKCKQRFQISRVKRDTWSTNNAPNSTTDTEMGHICNLHVQQTVYPRTRLNNALRSFYDHSAPDHIKWEVYSQGPPNDLTWHTTIYIDDLNYGYASAGTRSDAQDKAADIACTYLSREAERR
ncbi:hypothetical protein BDR03DRAFT_973980 [Suillus americanus]|nr:hypothetical protein BDR03DRAFT_973980 [Suillus americanus]